MKTAVFVFRIERVRKGLIVSQYWIDILCMRLGGSFTGDRLRYRVNKMYCSDKKL